MHQARQYELEPLDYHSNREILTETNTKGRPVRVFRNQILHDKRQAFDWSIDDSAQWYAMVYPRHECTWRETLKIKSQEKVSSVISLKQPRQYRLLWTDRPAEKRTDAATVGRDAILQDIHLKEGRYSERSVRPSDGLSERDAIESRMT